MSTVLVKVYGHCSHVPITICPALDRLAPTIIPLPDEQWYSYDDDNSQNPLLHISFEGSYFPLEEMIAILEQYLTDASQGKIDYIDMDAWTLCRYSFAHGRHTAQQRGLNHVLDHAGL